MRGHRAESYPGSASSRRASPPRLAVAELKAAEGLDAYRGSPNPVVGGAAEMFVGGLGRFAAAVRQSPDAARDTLRDVSDEAWEDGPNNKVRSMTVNSLTRATIQAWDHSVPSDRRYGGDALDRVYHHDLAGRRNITLPDLCEWIHGRGDRGMPVKARMDLVRCIRLVSDMLRDTEDLMGPRDEDWIGPLRSWVSQCVVVMSQCRHRLLSSVCDTSESTWPREIKAASDLRAAGPQVSEIPRRNTGRLYLGRSGHQSRVVWENCAFVLSWWPKPWDKVGTVIDRLNLFVWTVDRGMPNSPTRITDAADSAQRTVDAAQEALPCVRLDDPADAWWI